MGWNVVDPAPSTDTAGTAEAYWDPLWRADRRYRRFDEEEAKHLRHHAGPGRGRPALDIGCGEGALVQHLHGLGFQAVGVDCAPAALATGQLCYPHLDLRRMDFEHDDLTLLPHTAYALVTCRLVYQWIPDKPAFLARVRQLLPPGGLFWVGTSVHDQTRGAAQAWELEAADAELLTTGWSRVDTMTAGNYRCFALRP
ncbi:class I SAM-dependent methyltransferase [Streptomyces flavidovirens]|uniref:class I SAM-dependent methyltransferase n=1 Tax=Streptomyces flavidovirens TaxID=67298 RepID=UPI00342F5D37